MPPGKTIDSVYCMYSTDWLAGIYIKKVSKKFALFWVMFIINYSIIIYFVLFISMRPLKRLFECIDNEGYLKNYNPLSVVSIEYKNYKWYDIEFYEYENTSFHNEYIEEKNNEILYSFCIYKNWEYFDNGYGYDSIEDCKIKIEYLI